MNCLATWAHMAHDDCDGKQDLPLTPPEFLTVSPPCRLFSYRAPIENVCECGRKHTGPLTTCSSCSNKE